MVHAVKNLAVLGSTGSIGRQTLEVVRALPGRFRVIGLAAGNNTSLLAEQAAEFAPRFIYHSGKEPPPAMEGAEFVSLEEMARRPEVDAIVIATSGKAGLKAVLAAAGAGKDIALANKESLVIAGEIITAEVEKHKARILPVDSEHSALWQCLRGEEKPARLILTASGGPFRGYSPSEMAGITVEQALAHPSWKMGKKVTIDSATLMNKGLEIIEAHWLFKMPYNDISVVIHPQSIIHSMVEFADGSVKAQMSNPDMRLPIQYALTCPERLANPQLRNLDWTALDKLTFEQPDYAAFPCLKLAVEAGKRGGTYPAVLSAADEKAVELFLEKRIGFTDIAALVEKALDGHRSGGSPALEEILEADEWARDRVVRLVEDAGK
jgi:1-deoxy-D-xylulose-5-phosphate reductoisomerase